MASGAGAGDERGRASRRGRFLAWVTVGWNGVEAVVSIAAGALAGSTALVGFGVDSLIEGSSGAVMLWRFSGGVEREDRERLALRLVGISFLLLAGYLLYESVGALLTGERPDASVPGIVIAALSLIVMPVLARAKRRVARALDSRAQQADSRQTDLCMYLSAILLAGLGLNAAFGWWWADPVAGLVMVPIIVHEGWEALRGERCEDEACAV